MSLFKHVLCLIYQALNDLDWQYDGFITENHSNLLYRLCKTFEAQYIGHKNYWKPEIFREHIKYYYLDTGK